jgi:poly-gamma-glutamate synthesis protein (capsule biosynthesis protein)
MIIMFFKKIFLLPILILFLGCITGCVSSPLIAPTITSPTLIEPTPTKLVSTRTAATSTYRLWLSLELPEAFQQKLILPNNFIKIDSLDKQLSIEPTGIQNVIAYWVYALVAPFQTVKDEISRSELMDIWNGKTNQLLVMTSEVYQMISKMWGAPKGNSIQEIDERNLSDKIQNNGSWAILPFEKLDPQWKVLKINGISPLDKNFSNSDYALSIPVSVVGDNDAIKAFKAAVTNKAIQFPATNRDTSRMTSLILTGTTALTRDIATRMDEKGITYPAEKILNWFQTTDLVHISNEVSFKDDCDLRDRLKFCSKLEYFQLLKEINATIIELTGNHLLDFGPEPLLNTIDLYNQNNMGYYGGGRNLEEARKPLLIEQNGNKLAFLGCNAVDQYNELAGVNNPGANPCDRTWLKDEITQLKGEGYQVIVTYQDLEGCDPVPVPAQRGDFIFAAEAGAIIVSGSQAHCPQGMEFWNGAFIHYGLGNLFFDQMDELNRQEFLDRYTFYDGKLISIELLTAELEDSAQPRPMTATEREALLQRIFEASGWGK